ncbi:MAG: phosphoribosylanthranilate isomerase [Planctomycetota bacterium]|nr:phosphoribosylanthranilate isomerase [Planctomycetota bacterium]
MAVLFRIKICGITSVADAILAAESGADAVGLNFFPRSPRCVSPELARSIARALPPSVRKVGVFVNSPAEDVLRTAESVGLDLLQVHGDETPEDLCRLGSWPLLRAFRLDSSGLGPVLGYLDHGRELGRLPEAILVDAFRPGAYGGTGTVADWKLVRDLGSRLAELPVVLAGGLTPANVAAAIAAAAPAAVDTASGVESSPGHKEAVLVRQFVQRALAAFAQSTARSGPAVQ